MNQQPFPLTPPDDSGRPNSGDVPTGHRVGGYVVALVAGIPVALLMTYFALDTVVAGEMPGPLTLLMAASSWTGSGLAIAGMRARPRRFRAAALLLTLPSAVVLAAGIALFIFLIVALISGGTR